jgi:hypothetical protein
MGTFAITAITPLSANITLHPATANNQYQQHQEQVLAANQRAAQVPLTTDATTDPTIASANDSPDATQTESDVSFSDSAVADAESAQTAYADNSTSAIDNSQELAAIAYAQSQSEIQIALAASILNPPGSASALLNPAETAANQIMDVLNTTNGASPGAATIVQPNSSVARAPVSSATDGSLTSAAPDSGTAATPYDGLLSAINASMAAHPEAVPVTPISLNVTGNFVNSLV